MPGLVVFLILYGNFAGGVISLTAACVVALSPDLKLAGTRIGMNAGFYAFGLLVGNPIAGVIVQTSEGFVGQAVFAGLTLVVGLAFAISAMILHVRKESGLVDRLGLKARLGPKRKVRSLEIDSLCDLNSGR